MPSKKTLYKSFIHKNFDFWFKFLFGSAEATPSFAVNTSNESHGTALGYVMWSFVGQPLSNQGFKPYLHQCRTVNELQILIKWKSLRISLVYAKSWKMGSMDKLNST